MGGRRRHRLQEPAGEDGAVEMSTDTIVIIGAGQAGGWAAKTLRAEGFAGRIVPSAAIV